MVSGTPKTSISSRVVSLYIMLMNCMATSGFSEVTGMASMEPPVWLVVTILGCV